MEITYTHVAGLDVHKQTVVACSFTPGPKGKPQQAIQSEVVYDDDVYDVGQSRFSGLGRRR